MEQRPYTITGKPTQEGSLFLIDKLANRDLQVKNPALVGAADTAFCTGDYWTAYRIKTHVAQLLGIDYTELQEAYLGKPDKYHEETKRPIIEDSYVPLRWLYTNITLITEDTTEVIFPGYWSPDDKNSEKGVLVEKLLTQRWFRLVDISLENFLEPWGRLSREINKELEVSEFISDYVLKSQEVIEDAYRFFSRVHPERQFRFIFKAMDKREVGYLRFEDIDSPLGTEEQKELPLSADFFYNLRGLAADARGADDLMNRLYNWEDVLGTLLEGLWAIVDKTTTPKFQKIFLADGKKWLIFYDLIEIIRGLEVLKERASTDVDFFLPAITREKAIKNAKLGVKKINHLVPWVLALNPALRKSKSRRRASSSRIFSGAKG
ncbi:MAG: hypothetical protein GF308_02430 [Candidatus Heimdallarchaeota archaeon]|nr:hypothetical protein [Candidatus Heimdallarchaeota archaeon]